MEHLTRVADALIAFEWLTVCAYFIRRYVQHRKLVSIALAAMSLGWLLLGLSESVFEPERLAAPLKGSAIALGAFIWFAIWRVEKEGR